MSQATTPITPEELLNQVKAWVDEHASRPGFYTEAMPKLRREDPTRYQLAIAYIQSHRPE